jgi:hypothetical protein
VASFHFERALFVIGHPKAGKSPQLRQLFQDVRLGTRGNVPKSAKIPDIHRLSNERALYIRLTSPHETNETLDGFLRRTEKRIQNKLHLAPRWNFAGALQPDAANKMPNAPVAIAAFRQHFRIERVRAVFLNPDCLGNSSNFCASVDALWKGGTEVCSVDARQLDKNGLLLTDFFDFT